MTTARTAGSATLLVALGVFAACVDGPMPTELIALRISAYSRASSPQPGLLKQPLALQNVHFSIDVSSSSACPSSPLAPA